MGTTAFRVRATQEIRSVFGFVESVLSVSVWVSCELTTMVVTNAVGPLLGDLTCGTLLKKLQEILDEVGESDEQECLVYKSKVQQAAKSRVLHKVLEFVSTVHDLYRVYGNGADLRWIVKIPASSDGERRQLRRRSHPRLGSAT
ncbi:hypothetical protein YC2023_123251 [Brassica napus]